MEVIDMASRTRGLAELSRLRKRFSRDYGLGALSWDDFFFINMRLSEIEERLKDLDPMEDERASA
jgi:hypothetical protein